MVQDHYLQVTVMDFDRAARGEATLAANQNKATKKVAQKAAQQTAVGGRNNSKHDEEAKRETDVTSGGCGSLQNASKCCEYKELEAMGAVGFEPTKA